MFFSIIFGIIAELETAAFHGNQARARGRILHELTQKLAQGVKEDTVKIKDDEDYIIPGKIVWGAISIDSFVFAIICICLALLGKVISRGYSLAIFAIAIIFLIVVNIYLIRMREK